VRRCFYSTCLTVSWSSRSRFGRLSWMEPTRLQAVHVSLECVQKLLLLLLSLCVGELTLAFWKHHIIPGLPERLLLLFKLCKWLLKICFRLLGLDCTLPVWLSHWIEYVALQPVKIDVNKLPSVFILEVLHSLLDVFKSLLSFLKFVNVHRWLLLNVLLCLIIIDQTVSIWFNSWWAEGSIEFDFVFIIW